MNSLLRLTHVMNSLLRLTHVMNSIFLDPSDEFLTQVVNIGIPKQILGFCFHVSKRGYKIDHELTREENLLEAANALTSYRGSRGWQEYKKLTLKGQLATTDK